MRNYQRMKFTKYKLPNTVYHSALWKIRDYYRLKELADNVIFEKSKEGGCGKNFVSDKVASAVIRRQKYFSEINLIDETLKQIPSEYRKGVWKNIHFNQPYPLDASRSTYGKYKSEFIYRIAENQAKL